MVKAVFYTLGNNFGIAKTEMFDTQNEAANAIRDYALAQKFTRIQEVDDEDYNIRITATTPNGRAGRNVGTIELGWDE